MNLGLADRFPDLLENMTWISKDFETLNSQDSKSLSLEKKIAVTIIFLPLRCEMVFSIDFDHQF